MDNTTDDQNAREIRKTSLEFELWKNKAIEEHKPLSDVMISDELFDGFSLITKTKSESEFHSKNSTKYIFGDKRQNPEKLIEVILCECDSVSNAHESIVDYFMGSMANKIPRGEEKNVHIGDVTFIGYGEKVSSIVFARNNIMISIHSVGDVDIDVQNYAKKIDVMLTSKK